MRVRLAAVVAVVSALVVLAPAPAAFGDDFQSISLQASSGDGKINGNALLTVRRDHGGFDIVGSIISHGGCVVLKSKTPHMYILNGTSQIGKVCGVDRSAPVHAWTQRQQVVLVAQVPWGPDWESRSVTLTGTGG